MRGRLTGSRVGVGERFTHSWGVAGRCKITGFIFHPCCVRGALLHHVAAVGVSLRCAVTALTQLFLCTCHAPPLCVCSELGYGPAGKKSSANPDKCMALEGANTLQVGQAVRLVVLPGWVGGMASEGGVQPSM